MALTICNCFRQMRDQKVDIQQMVRNFPLFRSEQKKSTTSVGSIQFLNRFSGKLGCLPFSRQNNPQILVESEMERKFLGKFRSEIVDYLQRQTSLSVRNGTAEISLPFRKLSTLQCLISRQQLWEIELEMVSVISLGWFADFGEPLTIIHGSSQPVYSNKQ